VELEEAGKVSSDDVRQEERRLGGENLDSAILDRSDELVVVTVSLNTEPSTDA
jgi:hypothetical protein